MLDRLFIFFNEIKKMDNWKNRWIKKLRYNKNKSVVEVYERKFTKNEIKEICRNSKKKVVSIKEYRYDNDGFLKKVVIKDGDGTIKYINDVQYDEDYNIKSILAVSKKDSIELSKLSIIDRNHNLVEEDFRFVYDKDEIISQREVYYDENEDKFKYISGCKLKEDYKFNIDNNTLNIDYYDEDGKYLGEIVYGVKDMFTFALFNKALQYPKPENEFTITIKELMDEDEFLGISYKNDENSEFNDVFIQCFYKDRGKIQKVNFLKEGEVIYCNEYIYD